MNLKKVYKVVDSTKDIFSLVDEGLSADTLVHELNAYLPLSTKKEFLEHCDDAFDLAENLSSGDLVDYVNSQLSGDSAILLSEVNSYFSSDWLDAFIEHVVKDYDLDYEEEVEDSASSEKVEDELKSPVSKLLKLLSDVE